MRTHVIIRLIGMAMLVGFASLGYSAESVVNNPNFDAYVKAHPLESKPRDVKTVEAEKLLLIEAAQTIADYAKANGVDQAGAEVIKSDNGVFAKYFFGPQIRIALLQFTDKGPNGETGNFVILKGHNLLVNIVGTPLAMDVFGDLTGWFFLRDAYQVASSPQQKGWLNNTVWADEFWAGSKIVRYDNYVLAIEQAKGIFVLPATALDE